MGNSLTLDEKKLKRMPSAFVFLLILTLSLPLVAVNFFGMDFSAIAQSTSLGSNDSPLWIEAQIRGYFRQTLLQWSAFSLSAITVLLAFTQYRLTNDKIALVIGLAILFSGSVEALHTTIIDGLIPYVIDQKNLDAVIWTFANTISGMIILIGLVLLLTYEDQKTFNLSTFFLLSLLLILIAFTLIYYAASRVQLPQMWFDYAAFSRPYELSYLLIYFIIIFFIYPRVYIKHSCILTNCIFYMAVTQIVIALYMMLLSASPYDSAYHIAYFLKIIVYFLPCSCLIINYVFSYNAILKAQEKLRFKQNQLKYIASHDPLTNLYNRREFEHLLSRAIANSSRQKTSFALFVIDIDNFKSINDTLGHMQGDEFLKQFSEQLVKLTRKGDTLCRIGGDEFALITTEISSGTAARKLSERMMNGSNISYPVKGKLLASTVSLGIAIYPMDGDNTDDLLKNADIAMYSAKKTGKNTYCFYTKQLSSLQHREAEIESYLRKALENDEFTLCYQPKFNLVTKRVMGAEVLLRWHSNELGTISPDEFIPVAENTGLIINIEQWVLNQVCKQATQWLKTHEKPIVFAINLSSIQFENREFISHLKKTVEKYNYPPELLELEICESLVINGCSEITKRLCEVDRLGVTISIDDFGMGFSSLSRLKTLPIKTLKIDKLFISDIQNSEEKVVVIDTIIKLAQELGMKIIAEGIETKEQVHYLISKKCYLGQGFFLSKPLGAQKFEALVFGTIKEPDETG